MTGGFLTDEELIRLLEQKTPEELTLQELGYLKQRLADSAPLRESLLGHLQMETYLSAALGRIQLSPHEIAAKAEQQQARSWGLGFSLIALLVGVPVLGLAIAILYRAIGDTAASRSEGATVVELADAKKKHSDVPAASDPSTSIDSAADRQAEGGNHNESVSEGPAVTPAAAASVAAEEKTSQSAEGSPTPPPPPKPAIPWEAALAHQGELPDYEAIAFKSFDFDKRLPRQADLQPWFEAAPGSNFRLHEVDTRQGRCGAIEGVACLKAPWTDDSVLRVALEHHDKLQMHFYHSERGATIVYYEDQGGRWVAYSTTRKGNSVKPETIAATATDDDRARRTELRQGGAVEIRWRSGELILSRGDVVLLAAPLNAKPEDVFFEGKAAIQGIEFARANGDPPQLSKRPIVYDNERPAQLAWTLRKNDARQPSDPQPTVERLSSGGIRLAGDQLKHGADISTPIPRAGLHEFVFELENVTPGTSIFFGREKGQIEHGLKFLKNRRNGRTIARIAWIGDDHESDAEPHHQKPEPCLDGGHCWVKLLYGCGNLRWWLSTDGVHWAQLDHATDGAKGNLTTIGLHVAARRPQTGITLRRLQLRELSALSGIASAAAREKAIAFPEAANIGGWTAEALRSQPPEVRPIDWLHACSIRTLGVGAANELANDLLEALLNSKAIEALPTDRQLAVLDEAMLLAWDLRDNGAMQLGLPHRYLNVGLQAYDKQASPPWSTVRRSAMSAPVNTWLQAPPPVEPSIRWEMIAAINDLPADKTLELTRQLRFFHQQKISLLAEWAEATAQRESVQRSRSQGIVVMKDGWRHPLVENLSKDTYNLLNELQAVLDSEAWGDAARLVTSMDAEAAVGLAPYNHDRRLLVSLPIAVRLMLADYPDLKTALAQQFAPLARLRLNRAMAAGDWSEVELASVQFAGTEEAAQAHRWLGDRALASGWFERALFEYQRAQSLLPSLTQELAPRIRLAAAMLGREVGAPVTQSVSFGELRLDATQFEALVAEMRTRGNTGVAAAASAVEAPPPHVPPPAQFTAHTRSRLDGQTGDKPQEEVGRRTNQLRVPWADRQLSVVRDEDLMYVSNRFQVTAYRLSDGRRLWNSQQPEGAMQRAQQFALIAMRPLITSHHIYVRMLYTENPLLVCFHKPTGKIVWTSKLGDKEFFVSDPLVVRGQLGALSIQLQEGQEGLLRWNILDCETGEVQSQTDLLPLRNTWGARACCEVIQREDSLTAVLGGTTISFDPLGRLRWVRKHVVVPAEEDPRWILQRYQRPLSVEDRLYLTQPGVRTVECVDSHTGKEHWSVTLPDVLGIVGHAQGLLVLQTERGFRGLDLQTGEVRWRRPLEDVYPWQILSETSLLVAKWEKTPGNDKQFRTRFVWIDPSSGKELASSVVADLADGDPKLGPLLAFNDRLFTFFGKGQHEPTRDVVELVPSGAAEPARTDPGFQAWCSTTPELYAAAATKFSNWRLVSAMGGEKTGALPEVHGEKEVLGARSQANWPVLWARPITLPAESKRRLRIRLGADPGMQFKVQVLLNSTVIQEVEIKDETHPDRWRNLEVDLAPTAGAQGWLTVSAVHSGGPPSPIYWKTLELVD